MCINSICLRVQFICRCGWWQRVKRTRTSATVKRRKNRGKRTVNMRRASYFGETCSCNFLSTARFFVADMTVAMRREVAKQRNSVFNTRSIEDRRKRIRNGRCGSLCPPKPGEVGMRQWRPRKKIENRECELCKVTWVSEGKTWLNFAASKS